MIQGTQNGPKLGERHTGLILVDIYIYILRKSSPRLLIFKKRNDDPWFSSTKPPA